MDAGPEQELWYYDRCEVVTGRRFNHRWLERKDQSTWVPNSVIAAAWKYGKGKEVHQALKTAAIEHGEPILRREVALKLGARAAGIEERALAAELDNPELAAGLRRSLAEFNAYQIDQRPAFVLQSAIGDIAVFSGIYRPEPIVATLNAMIQDEDKFKQHAATHPPIPA